MSLSPLSILIVDDEPDTAESLSTLLSLHGFKARFVLNGKDALREAETCPPEVVILDIRMPKMSGLTLAKEFGAFSQRPLVIAITGSGCLTGTEYRREWGIDYYFIKPVDAVELVNFLNEISLKKAALGE